MSKTIFFCLVTLVYTYTNTTAQTKGRFTDPRDGRIYPTVTFDIAISGGRYLEQTWMASNLNYETTGSYCYKEEPTYAEIYGRLYTYDAAYAACPDGWDLPTSKDWMLLIDQYGGAEEAGKDFFKGGETGMDLLLAGSGNPKQEYEEIGQSGHYWAEESMASHNSSMIIIQKQPAMIKRETTATLNRLSLRCIKG